LCKGVEARKLQRCREESLSDGSASSRYPFHMTCSAVRGLYQRDCSRIHGYTYLAQRISVYRLSRIRGCNAPNAKKEKRWCYRCVKCRDFGERGREWIRIRFRGTVRLTEQIQSQSSDQKSYRWQASVCRCDFR
jgi:hypothetical protein